MSSLKLFTLDEAQNLVPVLQSLLKRAMDGKATLERTESETQELNRRIALSGGMTVDVTARNRRRSERDKAVQDTKDALAEIEAIGVQVKDLDIGLLDFPCRVDEEIVLLCWRYGEDKIEFWHGMEEGFRGRKPIDERIRRAGQREKPN